MLELDLDGERLLLKDVGARHPTKPGFMLQPEREIEVYRHVLAPLGIGAVFHGAAHQRLLLEEVEGVELWQLEHEAWVRVSRWLATMHRRLAPFAPRTFLLSLDRAYFAAWLDRARLGPWFANAHARAVERLLALPRVVIHNELYPSNVVVAGDRIVPVDWELTALGPAVIDVVALAAGWDGEEYEQILAAYGPLDTADVAAARLHLAVRWIGWSEGWTPPPEHRLDWRAEAEAAAALLE
jgi:hypothetical protein